MGPGSDRWHVCRRCETGGAVTVDGSTGGQPPVWDYEIPLPPSSITRGRVRASRRPSAVSSIRHHGRRVHWVRPFSLRQGRASGSTEDMSAGAGWRQAPPITSVADLRPSRPRRRRSAWKGHGVNEASRQHRQAVRSADPDPQDAGTTGRSSAPARIVPPAGSYQSGAHCDMPDPVHAGHGEAVAMWQHPASLENLRRLRDGWPVSREDCMVVPA